MFFYLLLAFILTYVINKATISNVEETVKTKNNPNTLKHKDKFIIVGLVHGHIEVGNNTLLTAATPMKPSILSHDLSKVSIIFSNLFWSCFHIGPLLLLGVPSFFKCRYRKTLVGKFDFCILDSCTLDPRLNRTGCDRRKVFGLTDIQFHLYSNFALTPGVTCSQFIGILRHGTYNLEMKYNVSVYLFIHKIYTNIFI